VQRFIFILFLIVPSVCVAQIKSIGVQNIINYPKSVYQAGTQNWGIGQDRNGFMYFANNDGLLCFDGLHWSLSKVSDSSPLRSVFIDFKNNIYVGLSNDFGLFTQNGQELPVFTSLRHLLPPELEEFDDIWRIHETSEGIVFQSYKYLFLYKDGSIEIIKPQNSFHFSFEIDNRFFVHEPNLGVFELINGMLTELPYWEKHKDKNISALLETTNNQLLICTEKDGLYKFEDEKIVKWNTPVSDFIEKNKLYSATSIPGNYFAFGTILKGLVIADSEGNIVQTLNSTNGLQNNTILSSFADKDGNLWLGLDNGIDYVEINSPLSFIGKTSNLGSGYCCKIFKENLYLGTNQGLYVRPFNRAHNNESFELVANTAGQVWSLEEFDGQLICGHNNGTYVVTGNNAKRISDVAGAWKYIRLKNNPDYLIGGHYNGLMLLKQGKDGWEFYKKLDGFTESSRFVKQSDDGNIWISHGTKGIFKVILRGLDEILEVKHYSVEDGLPSEKSNKLLELNGELYVSTIRGIYKYEKDSNSFKVAEDVNAKLNIDERIRVIEEDNAGNLWFISDYETGVLRHNEDLTYTKITAPFKKLSNKFVTEFEFIYPYNDENIFIGVNDGFAHYNSNITKSYSESFPSFITKAEVPYLDSVFYLNDTASILEMKLPFKKNTFRFHFAAPFYENDLPIQFSYFLEGFSDAWSAWSGDNYKDFSNLWEGEYVLKLKAKNIFDIESEMASVKFTISSPWYRSKSAYILYGVIFLLALFLFVKFMLYRINRAKQKEEQRHKEEMQHQQELSQRQALIAEKEIIKLRNDKLRAEKKHQHKELANQTIGLVNKNKLLINISEELQFIHNLIKNDSAKAKIHSLKKSIRKEIDNKQQNKIFETHFDEVHGEFFNRLKEKYPVLSPNDLRLCAFIKMNISTKEIATILNISYRGAEISRYRLRKKLELSRETNLSTFLLNI
jgi:ligand-binding sensor domain-containing protein/DNA-binding CsgD family transcriptional regulator